MGKAVKTAGLVCLAHDRYWPCKKLEPGERVHCWAYHTMTTTYAERKDDLVNTQVSRHG